MAYVFLHGWANAQSTYLNSKVFDTFDVNASYTTGRKAGHSLAAREDSFRTPALVASPVNTMTVGFAMRKEWGSNFLGDSTAGVYFYTGTDEQVSLVAVHGGTSNNWRWELRRGAAVIDTSTATFASGGDLQWHYFMLSVTARTGGNGTYELRHFDRHGNMTVVMSGSGVNLANQGADGIDRVGFDFYSNGLDDICIGDIFVRDDGSFPAQPLVILGALPDGDGSQNDWTTQDGGSDHYTMVDDNFVSSNPTGTYVQSYTTGDVELWSYTDPWGAGSTVEAVQVTTCAAMAASGSQSLRVRVRSGGAEATGTSHTVNSLVPESFQTIFETNPVTSSSWTATGFDSVEMGVEIA